MSRCLRAALNPPHQVTGSSCLSQSVPAASVAQRGSGVAWEEVAPGVIQPMASVLFKKAGLWCLLHWVAVQYEYCCACEIRSKDSVTI